LLIAAILEHLSADLLRELQRFILAFDAFVAQDFLFICESLVEAERLAAKQKKHAGPSGIAQQILIECISNLFCDLFYCNTRSTTESVCQKLLESVKDHLAEAPTHRAVLWICSRSVCKIQGRSVHHPKFLESIAH
jgi:hypothetical protein